MDERLLNDAYGRFLQTGKVADYLRYVQARRQPETSRAVSPEPVGGQSAHHNRRDRSAGAGG